MRVVSEEFAKKKLCPLSHAAGYGEGVYCVASDCLAWVPVPHPEHYGPNTGPLVPYKTPHGRCEAIGK